MKVTMKQLEKSCGEYTQKWNRKTSWDYLCIGKDSYINGYHQAIKDVLAKGKLLEYNCSLDDILKNIANTGQELVEVELSGTQIGAGND